MNKKKFTINELERFSDIKAHTIRAWERRYALLSPARTPNNYRLYTLEQLKKILNIALLKKNGYPISRLANAPNLEDKVGSLCSNYDRWQKAINDLTIYMYMEDPESFELLLDNLLTMWQSDILIENIIFPFLKITNLLWSGHKLVEEHLVVTVVRRKLILAIEKTTIASKNNKTILLFLPDSKQLDLGLLYCYYFLKRKGIHVLYLGNDITIQNLKSIFQFHSPNYLFTYLPQNHHFPINQVLNCMNEYAIYAKLIIGTYPFAKAAPVFRGNLILMDYLEALEYLESCK